MEHEKGKVVPFRREVTAEDTLIRGKTLMARTKHCSADDIRKKAREADRKQRQQQLEERRRLAAEEKRLQAERKALKMKKQRRVELMMFLILLLIVVLFFVIDAVIGTAADGTIRRQAVQDAVLMHPPYILSPKGS